MSVGHSVNVRGKVMNRFGLPLFLMSSVGVNGPVEKDGDPFVERGSKKDRMVLNSSDVGPKGNVKGNGPSTY